MKANSKYLIAFLYISYFIALVLYSLINFDQALIGDEIRYQWFADNLAKGTYTDSTLNLWNGPAYPLLLFLLGLVGSSKVLAVTLNIFFLIFTLKNLLFCSKLLQIPQYRPILALCWILYFPLYTFVPLMLTEIFAVYLMSSVIVQFSLFKHSNQNKHIILAGVVLGVLVLTKIIFAYVLLVCLMCFLIVRIFVKSIPVKPILSAAVLAFVITIPYLMYTQSVTGKMFYYGNSGGLSLYWMSTPYDDELGDWHSRNYNRHLSKKISYQNTLKNHEGFFQALDSLNFVEQDNSLRKQAIDNIINHPTKYGKNIVFNFSRFLFDAPKSSYLENGGILLYSLNPIVLLTFIMSIIVCMVNGIKKARWIHIEIHIICLVYIFISLLVSTYARMFLVTTPVALFSLQLLIHEIKLGVSTSTNS